MCAASPATPQACCSAGSCFAAGVAAWCGIFSWPKAALTLASKAQAAINLIFSMKKPSQKRSKNVRMARTGCVAGRGQTRQPRRRQTSGSGYGRFDGRCGQCAGKPAGRVGGFVAGGAGAASAQSRRCQHHRMAASASAAIGVAAVVGMVCTAGASGIGTGAGGVIGGKCKRRWCWLCRVVHCRQRQRQRQIGQRPGGHSAAHQTAQQQQSDKQHRNKARHGGLGYAL